MAAPSRAVNNTGGNLDPYKVPWFADCAPSLLTNRTIRRYLNAHSQHTWPEVIKLTLIYGVLGLEQQFPGGTLSIPQLRALVERGGAQLVVQRNLPGLQREILNLQTNLDAVFDRLAVEAPPPPAGPAAAAAPPAVTGSRPQQAAAGSLPQQQVKQQQPQQVLAPPAPSRSPSRPASALNPGPVAPKPPDEWRLGEKTGFPSPTRGTAGGRGGAHHPLRRSLDNQGATNPIYPDWWLAAGPPDPQPPKKVQLKVPRQQPRLAYSVQQGSAAGAAADDLVTAEYLMVPGTGYGQGQPEPVVGGAGPPVMLTSITADAMHTNPLAAAAVPAAAGAAGSSRSRRPQVAAAGAAAQSKIREAVAASRRKAAAQQQRRQQMLASAVAAGSSLFGQPRQQPPATGRSSRAVAAEAAAACAPAAAADHFLSNPWTSCFLQPGSAGPVDAVGYSQLPPADITADDEGRLGALAEEGEEQEEQRQLRAPAAYAALQQSLSSTASAAAAAGMQQEQLQAAARGRGVLVGSKEPAAAAAAADRPSTSRGVFADITSGLNSNRAAAAGSSSVAWEVAAADAAGHQGGLGGERSVDDWRALPLIEEEEEQQQQRPAHPPQHWQRREAWACDYGHLEGVEPPPAPPRPSSRQRDRASGGKRPHKRWSETWVGDFKHLEDFPRFARDTAFQHEQGAPSSDTEQEGATAAEAAPTTQPRSSRLFMSPADLQALVDAADQLGHSNREAAGAAAADEAPAATESLAARFAGLLKRWDEGIEGSAGDLPAGVAARADVSHAPAAAGASSIGSQTASLDEDAAALLLQDLQQAASELSTAAASEAGGAVDAAGAAVEAAAASTSSSSDGAGGDALSVPESHLEGMQEASQMLQQALTRHDALMQLISTLGGGAGSVGGSGAAAAAPGSSSSDEMLSATSTASASDLTV